MQRGTRRRRGGLLILFRSLLSLQRSQGRQVEGSPESQLEVREKWQPRACKSVAPNVNTARSLF